MMRLCLSLGLPLVLVVFLSSCSSAFFVPVRQQFITPDVLGILHENIELPVDGQVSLHGWRLIPAERSGGTILFLHGNGDNVSSHFANAYWLVDQGYEVYLFDYRGYGLSEGEADLADTLADINKMFDYTVSRLPQGEKLILMGHSLGGSLLIHAAADSRYKARFAAVISIGAFSDYRVITRDVLSRNWLTWLFQWPLSLVVDNRFRPLDAVSRISPVPLLIMHSRNDAMVAPYHGRLLYEQAKPPKALMSIEGDHNGIFNDVSNRRRLCDFLSGLPKTQN